jgi:hypothetical protein
MITMSNCTSNTLFISRPSKDARGNNCNTTCIGLTDPVDCKNIGKRRNREKVREQIKDYVLLMLGAPVVKVELDQQQLDAAVDLALQVFEDYAGREYYNYYVFNTTPGKSVYKMPDDVGLIRNVFYREQPGLGVFNGTDIGGSLPLEYYYPGGNYASAQGGMMDPNTPIYGRAGEWFLYKQYEQMYNRLSSQLGGWEWIGGYCHIKLYPIPCRCNSVIVHYLQKQPDFKQVTQAMQEGALAYAKLMLGRIRGKYTNIPGPSGGVQLDGKELIQEGLQEKKEFEERLISRFGDLPFISMD